MERYTCAEVSNKLLQQYLSVAVAATLLNNSSIKVSVVERGEEFSMVTELGRQGNVEKVLLEKSFDGASLWSITWEINKERTLLESINGSNPVLSIRPNYVCLIDETLEKNLNNITREAMGYTSSSATMQDVLRKVIGDN